jgi:hypothetical protein
LSKDQSWNSSKDKYVSIREHYEIVVVVGWKDSLGVVQFSLHSD